jgi:hypothetical protein
MSRALQIPHQQKISTPSGVEILLVGLGEGRWNRWEDMPEATSELIRDRLL